MIAEARMDRQAFLERRDWQVERLTELLLTGYSWKRARDCMMLSKDDFDRLLDAAVAKAQREREKVEDEMRLT